MQRPTQEQWRQLYETMARFKALAPWTWMHESNLVGVKDPESELILYCQVLGGMGEHFALSVYPGEEGLATLWHLVSRPLDDMPDPIEVLGSQLCLMASFEDRELLQKRDLDTIRELGLKFRGRGAWPLFRSYRPFEAPWFLTAEEARQLMLCLEQTMEVAVRFRDDRSLIPPAEPEGPYLIREPEQTAAGLTWKETCREIALPPAGGVSFSVPEDNYYEELLETIPATDGVIELDYTILPDAVRGEESERPFYPFLVLVAEANSGMILGQKFVRHEEIGEAIVDAFFDTMANVGMLPARVHVTRPMTAAILRIIAEPLDIEVREVSRLRGLDAFQQEFLGIAGRM